MTKKEKLKKLDEQTLDLQLEATADGGDLGILTMLTPTINYLRNNSVIEEKEKSTLEKDTQKRLKEAKERREKNESE